MLAPIPLYSADVLSESRRGAGKEKKKKELIRKGKKGKTVPLVGSAKRPSALMHVRRLGKEGRKRKENSKKKERT